MSDRNAIFLDRDGIFDELVYWGGGLSAPRSWPEVHFYPGLEDLAELKKLGYLLILITNQPDIERNIIEKRFVNDLNQTLKDRFDLDAVYVCPFSSDEHPLKKPNPGMLLAAQRDFSIIMKNSYFVGDTDKDILAARRAGCHSIIWDRPYNRDFIADSRVSSVKEIVKLTQNLKNIKTL